MGENPKFIQHQVTGWICDDVQAYREGLRRAQRMTDSDYQTMSDAALASFHSFSMETVASRFFELVAGRTKAAY